MWETIQCEQTEYKITSYFLLFMNAFGLVFGFYHTASSPFIQRIVFYSPIQWKNDLILDKVSDQASQSQEIADLNWFVTMKFAMNFISKRTFSNDAYQVLSRSQWEQARNGQNAHET